MKRTKKKKKIYSFTEKQIIFVIENANKYKYDRIDTENVRSIGTLNSIFRRIKEQKNVSSLRYFRKLFSLDTKKLSVSVLRWQTFTVSKGRPGASIFPQNIPSIHSHARNTFIFRISNARQYCRCKSPSARPFNQYRIPITLMILTIKIIFACKQYVNLAATRHKRGEVGWREGGGMGRGDGTRWNRNINRGHS